MATRRKPAGAVLYRAGSGSASDVVYAVAKWRDSTGCQRYRRLGRAWIESDGAGGWRRRRGAAPAGCLDRRGAERAMDVLIDEVEAELVAVRPDREATFADAVAAWREWAEHTKRLKPATLRGYDSLLAATGERPRMGGQRVARIMRAFGDRKLASITTAEIETFLRRLDREGLHARNVNAHRQAVANVFEYSIRADAFALPANPVRGAEKRREDYTKPPDTFTAEHILALARAAREGRHVNGGRRWASKEKDLQQELANAQDAALYTVAGFTGLRQGELRALRWKHVRFADRTLVVVAGMSAGLDSTTKSGKWRAVPLAREAFVALDELSRRDWFTGPDDFVFCGPAGDPLDDSALRRRYNAARDAAGLPPLPFHHLRHTFATLAIRGLDPATVQTLMGHSKITTTERYLHARPLAELAERMDAIFEVAAVVEQQPTR
ncbi:MAG: tyrosine-type recombinase/integrase [Pseudonocardiaceae bacterium]